MVDCGGLLSRCPVFSGTLGSNPSLSAIYHLGYMASPELQVVQGRLDNCLKDVTTRAGLVALKK